MRGAGTFAKTKTRLTVQNTIKSKSEKVHVAGDKGGKMHATKSRLILVLPVSLVEELVARVLSTNQLSNSDVIAKAN